MDRERLITLAVRIENHLQMCNKEASRRDGTKDQRRGRNDSRDKREDKGGRGRTQSPRRDSHTKRPDGVTTGANNTPTHNTRDRSKAFCFRCKQEGHYNSDCTMPEICYNCNKPGHKAYVCPEPRKPGKAGAPQ